MWRASDLIADLQRLKDEYGDLPVSMCETVGYSRREEVTRIEGDEQFNCGRPCFLIEYVPR